MENEKYIGRLGHTEQLMRIKSEEFEFSIFRIRQRGKKGRGCTSRIWLMKRFFVSGVLIRVRITAEALTELAAIETEALKLLRCETLWSEGKHRTTGHETPERPA